MGFLLPAGLIVITALVNAGATWWLKWSGREGDAKLAAATAESAKAASDAARAADEMAVAKTDLASAARASVEATQRANEKLDAFRLHDDTMTTLYWAADHAISPNSTRALLGLEVLGELVTQASSDGDLRAGRIVAVTRGAVRTVAIPTFMSVLTTAASTDSGHSAGSSPDDADPRSDDDRDGGGGGRIHVTAVESNAAKLLMRHAAPEQLAGQLRVEVQAIATARLGTVVNATTLYAGRHLDPDPRRAADRPRPRTTPSHDSSHARDRGQPYNPKPPGRCPGIGR